MINKLSLPIFLFLILALSSAFAESDADPADSEIRRMEERLTELGYMVSGDSEFNDTTEAALEAFQTANGLHVTGAPDRRTIEAMNAPTAISKKEYLEKYAAAYASYVPLENGSKGANVKKLQKALSALGYLRDTCDGVFGGKTENAVKRFQMANGLSVTGIADASTFLRLLEGNPLTWKAFLGEMRAQSGDAGLNVHTIQIKLTELEYYEGDCTGIFGNMTLDAVSRFQQNNGLPSTGIADEATLEQMYSDDAIIGKRDASLEAGDYGQQIREAQSRLTALGYYNRAATGDFSVDTETSVRLFQMANEIPVSGKLDAVTLEKMSDPDALHLMDDSVTEHFNAIRTNADANVFGAMSEIAGAILGEAFATQDDVFYPGFSFVQYVCVAAGLPVTDPNTLLPYIDEPFTTGDLLPEGSVVMFMTGSEEEQDCLLAVSVGNDRVLYATAEGGWVVMSDIVSMDADAIYIWTAEEEPHAD